MVNFDIHMIRHIFQHHIDIHECWEPEKRAEFAKLFDLDDEELEEFDKFIQFIVDHGLERLKIREKLNGLR